MGVCIALTLQRSGRRVTVIERANPGDGASGHNAGIFSVGDCVPTAVPGVVRSVPGMLRDPLSPLAIRWSYLPRIAPWLIRFALAGGKRRVEEIAVALQSLTDRAISAYQPLLESLELADLALPGGALHAYRTDASFAAGEYGRDLRARRGVSFQVLDDAGIAELDPGLAGRFRHGVYQPGAWFTTDPRGFTGALAARFTERGGRLLRAEADGFEQRGGAVRAVLTDEGRVSAGGVVIAAGAWSRRLVRKLGIDVPLDTERGYGVHLPDPGVSLRLPILSGDYHFALAPAAGGIRLAGTDELAGLKAPPNFARADTLIKAARTVFPELRTDGAVRWMSYRPSLPDSLPVIGRVPGHTNAYLAFGHGHKGLTAAAITAELVEQLIDGRPTSVDLAPFSPRRFSHIGRWTRSADRARRRVVVEPPRSARRY